MKVFAKLSLILAVLAVALAFAPAALADSYSFTYTYTDSNVSASGTLDATLLSPGEYAITGGTIDLTGAGIPGTGVVLGDPAGPDAVWTLQNPPNSGGANLTADNQLSPGSNFALDGNGFNFELTNYTGPAGGISGNIWGNGPGNYGIFEGSYNIFDSGGGSFDLTSGPTPLGATAPEPSSLLLLGTGLLSLAVIVFRKAKQPRPMLFS